MVFHKYQIWEICGAFERNHKHAVFYSFFWLQLGARQLMNHFIESPEIVMFEGSEVRLPQAEQMFFFFFYFLRKRPEKNTKHIISVFKVFLLVR